VNSQSQLLQGKTIVLLEDNPDDEELTVLALRKAVLDCNVVVLRNDSDAAKYFNSIAGQSTRPPDLIVIGAAPWIFEPWMQLATRHCDVQNDPNRLAPVVVFHSLENSGDTTTQSCASAIIFKPHGGQEFITVVQKLALHWLNRDGNGSNRAGTVHRTGNARTEKGPAT